MKLRQYLIIFIFFSICIGLSVFSYLGHFDEFGNDQSNAQKGSEKDVAREVSDESFFKGVNYYSVQNTRPFIELESAELSLSSTDGVVIGFDPNGAIYRYDKNFAELEPIYFKAKNSRAMLKKKEIFLDKEVQIKLSNTTLSADKVSILSEGEILYAYDNVQTLSIADKTLDQIIVNSNSATYRPKQQYFEYKNNVSGIIKRNALS